MQASIKRNRSLEYEVSRFETYNKNSFYFKFLGKSALVTREAENIKAILATQFSDFCLGDRYQQFHPFLGDGIFTLDGKGWSTARTFLRPQFSKDQVGITLALLLCLSVHSLLVRF